jgi:hypothetical protein
MVGSIEKLLGYFPDPVSRFFFSTYRKSSSYKDGAFDFEL